MRHVPLNITRVIDVGGVSLCRELCLLGHKIISDCLVMRGRRPYASVTHITCDINDTFVTDQPDDRKTLLCW